MTLTHMSCSLVFLLCCYCYHCFYMFVHLFFTVLLFSYSAARPQVWNKLSVSVSEAKTVIGNTAANSQRMGVPDERWTIERLQHSRAELGDDANFIYFEIVNITQFSTVINFPSQMIIIMWTLGDLNGWTQSCRERAVCVVAISAA